MINLQVFLSLVKKLADFMIKNTNNSPSLFSSLSDMQNQSPPLYQLADKIDRGKIVSQKVCLMQVCLRSDDAKLIDNFVFHIKKVNFMLYLDEERVLQRSPRQQHG